MRSGVVAHVQEPTIVFQQPARAAGTGMVTTFPRDRARSQIGRTMRQRSHGATNPFESTIGERYECSHTMPGLHRRQQETADASPQPYRFNGASDHGRPSDGRQYHREAAVDRLPATLLGTPGINTGASCPRSLPMAGMTADETTWVSDGEAQAILIRPVTESPYMIVAREVIAGTPLPCFHRRTSAHDL